jgi:hypothetical protein
MDKNDFIDINDFIETNNRVIEMLLLSGLMGFSNGKVNYE